VAYRLQYNKLSGDKVRLTQKEVYMKNIYKKALEDINKKLQLGRKAI